MKRKRRKVQPAQPGERRQYAPGALVQSLDPTVRAAMEELANAGYAEHGRGLLIVEINDAEESGIVSSEYLGMARITELNRRIPFAEAQPGPKQSSITILNVSSLRSSWISRRHSPARNSGSMCFHARVRESHLRLCAQRDSAAERRLHQARSKPARW